MNDAPHIAKVHVDAWRETYQGTIPDSILENLDVANRTGLWKNELMREDARGGIFVAERQGDICGFASGGRERSNRSEYEGELHAIYVLKSGQGIGAGRRLFEAVTRRLSDRGYTSMLVWVLERNPACGFYEAMGGRRIDSKSVRFGEADLIEVAYGFDDITGRGSTPSIPS